jgi:hypothetical protein
MGRSWASGLATSTPALGFRRSRLAGSDGRQNASPWVRKGHRPSCETSWKLASAAVEYQEGQSDQSPFIPNTQPCALLQPGPFDFHAHLADPLEAAPKGWENAGPPGSAACLTVPLTNAAALPSWSPKQSPTIGILYYNSSTTEAVCPRGTR